MIAVTPGNALLIMWITFTIVAVGGLAAVLVWAIRNGQFSDQDRMRHLALQSGIPTDEEWQRLQEKKAKSALAGDSQ